MSRRPGPFPGVWPSGLPPRADRALRDWVRRHPDARVVRAARGAVYGALSVLHTEDHCPATNGEAHVLRCLARATGADHRSSRGPVLFDVGANRGAWAVTALDACPGARVHCFELVRPVRRRLHRLAAERSGIVVAEAGLADRPGVRRVKYYPACDELSSLYDYPHEARSEWRDEPVLRGDDYLSAHGIDGVDLLKIDTEGAELEVLAGFRQALGAGRVAAVQFEYGYSAILSGSLLYRSYDLLGPLGYRLGRILPQRVDFRPYTLFDERFFGPNFLAVHRSRPDLVRLLAGRGTPVARRLRRPGAAGATGPFPATDAER
ncbi:FkbM family methyltransferase [Streptomyces sp. NRRL S-87]|uniref:FkbM family methyltransferase n=1 Tax=Streptomyces sp. NRRL S-87 TaxID=1463920 RepID=UPI00131BF49C|nr:FkbM family methyltransferase [Streptomyces sp. NRRL S-87]